MNLSPNNSVRTIRKLTVMAVTVAITIGAIALGSVVNSASAATSTKYVKVPFSDRVYKESGSADGKYVSHAQYVAAGRPHISTVSKINGDIIQRYEGSAPVYYLFPDGYTIHMTMADWNSIGHRADKVVPTSTTVAR